MDRTSTTCWCMTLSLLSLLLFTLPLLSISVIVHGTADSNSFVRDNNNFLTVHVNTTRGNFSSTPTYFSWVVSDCDIIFTSVSVQWNVSQFGFDVYPYDEFSGNRVNVSSVENCDFQIRWIAFKDGENISGLIYGSTINPVFTIYNDSIFYGGYTIININSFDMNPAIFTSMVILGNPPIQPYYGLNSIYFPDQNNFRIYIANFTNIPNIQINWLTAHPSCIFNVSAKLNDPTSISFALPNPNVFTTLNGVNSHWRAIGVTTILRNSSKIIISSNYASNILVSTLLYFANTNSWLLQYLDFSICNNSLAIDCQSTWSSWGTCMPLDTPPCKNGTRRRDMNIIPAEFGGIPCNQTGYQNMWCPVRDSGCLVDCVWGSWGSWSGCPLCGENVSEIRYRNVTQMNGVICSGNNTDSSPCPIPPCIPCATVPQGFTCINGNLEGGFTTSSTFDSINTTLIGSTVTTSLQTPIKVGSCTNISNSILNIILPQSSMDSIYSGGLKTKQIIDTNCLYGNFLNIQVNNSPYSCKQVSASQIKSDSGLSVEFSIENTCSDSLQGQPVWEWIVIGVCGLLFVIAFSVAVFRRYQVIKKRNQIIGSLELKSRPMTNK